MSKIPFKIQENDQLESKQSISRSPPNQADYLPFRPSKPNSFFNLRPIEISNPPDLQQRQYEPLTGLQERQYPPFHPSPIQNRNPFTIQENQAEKQSICEVPSTDIKQNSISGRTIIRPPKPKQENRTKPKGNEAVQRTMDLTEAAKDTIISCQEAGIGFNSQKHTILMSSIRRKMSEALQQLVPIFGNINLNSAQQLSDWFKVHCPDPSWPITERGQYKTDMATLKQVQSKFQHMDLLMEYKKHNSLITKFDSSLCSKERNGRIYATFNPYGCKTGRISSENPNLQQIPREKQFRELFVPSPGHLFLVGDYSQIELRVAAALSQDPQMIACYEKGEDLHTATAKSILNSHTVSEDQRTIAKAINFGILYGGSAAGLKKNAEIKFDIQITLKDAHNYIKRFQAKYSKLKKWQDDLTRNQRGSGNRNQALNNPVQRGAAEVMLICLAKMGEEGFKIVNIIHDEIIVESKVERALGDKRQMQAIMQESWEEYLKFCGTRMSGSVVEVDMRESWAKN